MFWCFTMVLDLIGSGAGLDDSTALRSGLLHSVLVGPILRHCFEDKLNKHRDKTTLNYAR